MKQARGEVAVLVVHPGNQWIKTSAAVVGSEARRELRAREAVAGFAREYGARVDVESARRVAPTEYGMEVDGLASFGEPGVSSFWADESPGEGRVELETQSEELAEILFKWAEGGCQGSIADVVP